MIGSVFKSAKNADNKFFIENTPTKRLPMGFADQLLDL